MYDHDLFVRLAEVGKVANLEERSVHLATASVRSGDQRWQAAR